MTQEIDAKPVRRSRIKLIVLAIVFMIPILAAYFFYKFPQYQPTATSNNGVLYKPVVALKDFQLKTADAKPYSLADMRGKWSLIYIGKSDCDMACQETLLKARDARWAQGMEATRIRYYYLLSADTFNGDLKKLNKDYPGLIMLQGDRAARKGLIAQFRVNASQVPGSDNRLYLVDPVGRLLMHYPYGFRHIGLMEDLKHLLKWSRIG